MNDTTKYQHHYLIDSKLLFYGCNQTGRDVLDTFNDIAKIIINSPKGRVYIGADLGSSKYRLSISKYYKGSRREKKAKLSDKEKEAYIQFSKEYVQFVQLCKKLPVTVMDVTDTEADDVLSILAKELAEDPYNRVSLVTRDQDYGHSVIDHNNVKIVSPYYTESDRYSNYYKNKYAVRSREEFTLKKTLEGDQGDGILHIKWFGPKTTDEIWENCLKHPEVTLEILRSEIHDWIDSQKRPEKYIVPYKYIEYNVASTLDELIDVNYKLAATMESRDQLYTEQKAQYEHALEADHTTCSLSPIDDGFTYFGRPIMLTDEARRVFNVTD